MLSLYEENDPTIFPLGLQTQLQLFHNPRQKQDHEIKTYKIIFII